MGARAVVIAHVRQQHVAQMAFAEYHDMINAFLPIDPISRSAYAFCHGERGEVGRSRMPIDRTRRDKYLTVGSIAIPDQVTRDFLPVGWRSIRVGCAVTPNIGSAAGHGP